MLPTRNKYEMNEFLNGLEAANMEIVGEAREMSMLEARPWLPVANGLLASR